MEEGFVSLKEELENYVWRACEFIRSVFPYSEAELLSKHEVDFYRIMARAEARVKEQERAQKGKR